MASRIKLVQGDTRPNLIVTLMDRQLNEPLDLSPAGTVVEMAFRPVGGSTLAIVPAILLDGLELEDKSITRVEPYNTPGRGGRINIAWNQSDPAGVLDVDPGPYEGEITVYFQDGTQQTLYDLLKFTIRADF